MRPLLVSAVGAAIVVAFGLGYLLGAGAGDDPATPPSASTPTAAKVTFTTVAIKEESDRYTLDIRYPQLGFATDARIKVIAEQAAADIRDLAAKAPPTAAGKYFTNGYFDSVYIGPDVVSLRFVISWYSGGAHGGRNIHAFNIDPASGRELTLNDALKMISLDLSSLSERTTRQLQDKLGFIFAEGALPQEKNYSVFLVGGDDVTFIFQEYQVAPYAAGPQEVSYWRRPVGER